MRIAEYIWTDTDDITTVHCVQRVVSVPETWASDPDAFPDMRCADVDPHTVPVAAQVIRPVRVLPHPGLGPGARIVLCTTIGAEDRPPLSPPLPETALDADLGIDTSARFDVFLHAVSPVSTDAPPTCLPGAACIRSLRTLCQGIESLDVDIDQAHTEEGWRMTVSTRQPSDLSNACVCVVHLLNTVARCYALEARVRCVSGLVVHAA